MTFCGRTTKRGTGCEASPLLYWQLPKREGRPKSCLQHLTDEERASYEAEQVEAARRREAALRAADDVPPACWSWALPDCALYGMAALRSWQQGRCAICADAEALVVDHDHKTGLVRGLLCQSCNTREAVSNLGPYRMYRAKHPTSILGLRLRYWDPITGEYAQPAPPAVDAREENPMRGIGL